jgi:hypothetical protein
MRPQDARTKRSVEMTPKADAEHQECDGDARNLVDACPAIDEVQCVGADGDPREEISGNGLEAQSLEEPRDDRGDAEECHEVKSEPVAVDAGQRWERRAAGRDLGEE